MEFTENQASEMFKLLTTAVTKINEFGERLERVEAKQDKLQQGQDELRREFEIFREETRANFDKLNREAQLNERKLKIVTGEVLDANAKFDDLIERVERLEQKQAA